MRASEARIPLQGATNLACRAIIESGVMISLCCIAKNEERFIREFVAHHLPLVDEIIIVDTGSTDATRKIASDLGARVLDFKWCDDFSAARNFSIDHANHPWILWLDIDERLSAQDVQRLRKLTESGESAYTLTVRNYTHSPVFEYWRECEGEYPAFEANYPGYFESRSIRFFKNTFAFRFEGRVHETIRYSLPAGYVTLNPPEIVIHHYGNLEEIVAEKRKKTLYNQIAKSETSDSPHYWFAQFCIGRDAAEAGRLQDAAEAFERAKKFKPDNHEVLNNLGFVYMQLGRAVAAEQCFEDCLKAEPYFAEAWLNLGLINMERGDLKSALEYLDLALLCAPGFLKAERARAQCLAKSGHINESVKALEAIIRAHPNEEGAVIDLAIVCFASGWVSKGQDLLKSSLLARSIDPAVAILKAQYLIPTSQSA